MNVHIHDDHLAVGFPSSHDKDSNDTEHKILMDNHRITKWIQTCPNSAEFSTKVETRPNTAEFGTRICRLVRAVQNSAQELDNNLNVSERSRMQDNCLEKI